MQRIVIASGGFDPLHSGHVRYLQAAKSLGEYLLVILNSDDFLIRKKGFRFMVASERKEIIASLTCVDLVVNSIDEDQTVCNSLRRLHVLLMGSYHLIFAKGGDRTAENIPEIDVCRERGIECVFDVGGGKIQSSSELVANAKRKEDKA